MLKRILPRSRGGVIVCNGTAIIMAVLMLAGVDIANAAKKTDCGSVTREGHTAYDITTSGDNCIYAREVVARYLRAAPPGHTKILRHGRRTNRCSWKSRVCVYQGGTIGRRGSGRSMPTRVVRWAWTVPYNTALASWYNLVGQPVGCPGYGTLPPGAMNVAHKSMACGTRIEFCFRGCAVATVTDRGPYAGAREFDLGPGTAAAIGFSGVQVVRYRVLR